MATFEGFDHIDTRVRSLSSVEAFYDTLMPQLGLSEKRFAHVDAHGDWDEPSAGKAYNAVEYYEPSVVGHIPRFIGLIEDRAMTPTLTRIAFRVATPQDLPRWDQILRAAGAANIQWSASDLYPAIFFEDPAGTKLELVSRRPAP